MQAQLISINPLKNNFVSLSFESNLESGFWDSYENLWWSSKNRSPFQAPAYLSSLASQFPDGLAAFKMIKRNRLLGAVLFRKQEDVYHLLSDVRSDHNYFIIHETCSDCEIREFYQNLFRHLRKLRSQVFLKNIPSWTRDVDILLHEVKHSRMIRYLSKQKVCMVLNVNEPEEVSKFLLESGDIRERERKLIRHQKPVFEIFTGEEYLDDWLEGYYALHRQRWNSTDTPSKYNDKEQRDRMRRAILSWIDDGIIVRFSIRIGTHRIAYAVCLLHGKTLIHHTTAFDIAYKKYSPGRVLLLTMARWMKEHGFVVLDFGEGGESYKKNLTNQILPLYNILLSPPEKVGFIIKARLMNDIKNVIQHFGLAGYTKKVLTYIKTSS